MLRKNVARLPIALTAALFTTVAALSHEVAIFYTPYYLWLFQARDKDWRRALGMFSFVAVPAVIVTAAAYLRPGDADVIAAICKSLGGSAPSDCNSADMAAISFLSRSSIVHEMGVTLRLTARLRYSETYSLVVVLLSVPWLLYLRRDSPCPAARSRWREF